MTTILYLNDQIHFSNEQTIHLYEKIAVFLVAQTNVFFVDLSSHKAIKIEASKRMFERRLPLMTGFDKRKKYYEY